VAQRSRENPRPSRQSGFEPHAGAKGRRQEASQVKRLAGAEFRLSLAQRAGRRTESNQGGRMPAPVVPGLDFDETHIEVRAIRFRHRDGGGTTAMLGASRTYDQVTLLVGPALEVVIERQLTAEPGGLCICLHRVELCRKKLVLLFPVQARHPTTANRLYKLDPAFRA
jgi:hypothetical protein